MSGSMADWVKSSYSKALGNCVEVKTGDAARVRDSKNPDGPVLKFPGSTWGAFLRDVKAGS